MTVRGAVNTALRRATGFELRRVGRGAAPAKRPRRPLGQVLEGDRLVRRPVFILCTLRSGSTLLRVLLNSHTQLHAPHELHLRYVSVAIDNTWSERSMTELGLDEQALRYLLWDRILHRELAASGKPTVVEKTPNNVFIPGRIKECWPDARFIFLLRHPAAIARSRETLRQAGTDDANLTIVRRYCAALERARQAYPGHTVRYEELTTDPGSALSRLCDFLEVPYEPAMVRYGEHDHGRYRSGLGDWAEKIRTGQIQPSEPPPAETPEPLIDIARAWGYAPTSGTSG